MVFSIHNCFEVLYNNNLLHYCRLANISSLLVLLYKDPCNISQLLPPQGRISKTILSQHNLVEDHVKAGVVYVTYLPPPMPFNACILLKRNKKRKMKFGIIILSRRCALVPPSLSVDCIHSLRTHYPSIGVLEDHKTI